MWHKSQKEDCVGSPAEANHQKKPGEPSSSIMGRKPLGGNGVQASYLGALSGPKQLLLMYFGPRSKHCLHT